MRFLCIGVSENSGTPKSSILIGFSIINHPFWGTTIFGNIHIYIYIFIHPTPPSSCFPLPPRLVDVQAKQSAHAALEADVKRLHKDC